MTIWASIYLILHILSLCVSFKDIKTPQDIDKFGLQVIVFIINIALLTLGGFFG